MHGEEMVEKIADIRNYDLSEYVLLLCMPTRNNRFSFRLKKIYAKFELQ
jgi:hypothetical protein